MVEKDRSYLQIRDKTGQMQTVSRYGSGDSSLKKGETVYQDLDIQGGSIVQKDIPGATNNVYKEDSSGGRVISDRHINVNPQQLVSNRGPAPALSKPSTVYRPYSQQAENGQVTVQHLKQHADTNSMRMITTETEQVLVSKDPKTNKEYRFSSVGKGDPSLRAGERRESSVKLANHRLKVSESTYFNDNTGEIKENIPVKDDPNHLMSKPYNPRYRRRMKLEQQRNNNGSIY